MLISKSLVRRNRVKLLTLDYYSELGIEDTIVDFDCIFSRE